MEGISLSVLFAVSDHREKFLALFTWYEKNAARFDARLTSYDCLRELELYMPRGAKKNGTTANNGTDNRGGKGSDVKWVWGNCKLSDEDTAELSDSEDTLEYLATCLAGLGNDGFGFTCKPVDKGESHCCTIFRPDFPVAGTTIGVSAFAGNIRDAILACLYKLDTYGGGDFTGFDVESGNTGSKSRFR